MNVRSLNYIGILGYSDTTSKKKKTLIEELTSHIVMHGMGICAGSVHGPSYLALRQAKLLAGNTRLISEIKISHCDRQLCDILEMVNSFEEKHDLIAKVCVAGIVVAKGIETEHLMNCFKERKKQLHYLSDLNVREMTNIDIFLNTRYLNEYSNKKLERL